MEWWLAYAKPNTTSFFRWKSKIAFDDFHREQQRLYGLLRHAYDSYQNNRNMLTTINRIKAEMLAHQRRFSEMFVQINQTYVAGEPLSTFQLGERARRRTTIERLRNERDEEINDTAAIQDHMVQYFTQLYARERLEEEADQATVDTFRCERIIPEQDAVNEATMDEITTVTILSAIRSSAARKSPGPDGLPKEFYLRTFNVIHRELNLILNDAIRSNFPPQFVDGVIVLVKKRGGGDTARSYRPISLVNVDYKLLARILKQRLELVLRNHNVLTRSQKCSNAGRNIFQATLAVKDRIAQMKANGQKGKLISFDLDHAFDRVNQSFLFTTMRNLGFNAAFVDLLSCIATHSTSRLLINGHLSAPFPIQRSVRQGCPIAMHCFVLYLHPLLRRLEQVCGTDLIVAYADDISAIATSNDQLNMMRDLFRRFERVAGARLNEAKTTSIDVGLVNNPLTVPWLRTENSIKILGIVFVNSVRLMTKLNWDPLVANFSRQIWLHSFRILSLHQKVTLLNTFLLSKMWYIAAYLHPSVAHVAKVTATMRNFLFRGACATVPMQQLARSRETGGLKLHLPAIKCKALLINRHLQEIGSLPYYNSHITQANPPQLNPIRDLPCLKLILSNIINFPFQIRQSPSADLIHRFYIERTDRPKVEITNPGINWPRVWRNISTRHLLSSQRSVLYMWVNQKVPHRRLLHTMRRTDGNQCTYCAAGSIETIQHKYFACPRIHDAFNILTRKLQSLAGSRRVLDHEDLLRPSLDRISATLRTQILKHLAVYITFIDDFNGRIDVDINELLFSFQFGV